jgi:hypothetical protein
MGETTAMSIDPIIYQQEPIPPDLLVRQFPNPTPPC